MRDGRLIFECPVLNGMELVSGVSREMDEGIGFRPATKLHLTLLYVGDLEALLRELRSFSQCGVEQFSVSADFFVRKTLARGSASTHASVTSIETLVSKGKSYIVAMVEPSDELAALRRDAWGGFMTLLESVGVSNPDAFVRHSSVVDLPGRVWLPHVTLAKGAETKSVILSSARELLLGPLKLHS